MARSESGLTVGGYRIEARIGRGGMGIVYRATHMALDRQVALKVIADELAEDEGFRERFRREPKLAASIDHPNVIPVFDAGEDSEQLFVAMRYVDGSDLRSLIADEGRLEPARAARIVAQVADALDAAHELGLVHRDVKPANVLIENRNGREHVYLTDFGLTKGGEGTTALTKTGQWVGTPDYVAPEQIHGGLLDRRTDIYALGAVLYHALSGQPPYGRETEVAKIYAHLSKPPPELPEDVDASPQLKETIRQAMAKEPAERYASAGELGRDALAAAGVGRPGPSDEAPAPTVPAQAPAETVPAETVAAPGETAAAAPGETAPAAPGQTAAAPEKTAPPAPHRSTAPPGRTAPTPPPPPPPPRATATGKTAAGPGATVAADTAELESEGAVRPATPAPGGMERMLGDRRAVGAMAAVAIIVFAALGFVLGNSGGDGSGDASSFSNSASSGTLALRFPGGWEQASQGVAIPGVTFRDQFTLAPGSDGGTRLAAGQVDARGPSLLPAGLVRLLGNKAPSGEPVKLGSLEALRYSNLRPKGLDGALTLFAVPTTVGVATVACVIPPGISQSVAEQCQQIASTLQLAAAKAFPIGPDKAYAGTLDRTIAALNTARKKKLKQTRKAKTPDAQASPLDDLAGSYRAAAKRLAAARVSPAAQPANDAIVGALRQGKDAFTGMAAAARSSDEGKYDSARAAAKRADSKLKKAVRRLNALGYEVKGAKA